MYWNYRVIVHPFVTDEDPTGMKSPSYTVNEVYYKKGDKITGWIEDPADIASCVSVKDMKGSLKLIKQAFKRPHLNVNDLPGDE